MKHPYDKKNYQIWRSVDGYEFRAICVDEQGEPAFDVHEDTPDNDIWNILLNVKMAYDQGVRVGQDNEKLKQIAAFIADDASAITHQSLGQYRATLKKLVE